MSTLGRAGLAVLGAGVLMEFAGIATDMRPVVGVGVAMCCFGIILAFLGSRRR